MLKCLVFHNGLVLIGIIEEISAELGNPDCQLKDFCEIKDNKVQKWVSFTDDKVMLIRSENIFTIFNPSEEIKKMYFEVN